MSDTREAPGAASDERAPALEETPGLDARNLGKVIRRRAVVSDVSMNVRRGEVVGLLGPNGAGKTTCFYMIMGLVRADRGRVLLDGQDVTSLPLHQRARLGLGYLPQEPSIFRGLDVEKNLLAVLEISEKDPQRRSAMLEDLLSEFQIERLRRSPSAALSGGERRRVEIARALAAKPSFLLLDEPFAGIDPIAVSDIRDLILHLKTRGLGVLITDHNVRETLDIVDRAVIIHGGRVLSEGSPAEVIDDPAVRKAYLGEGFRM